MGATTLEDLKGQLAEQVKLGGELKAAVKDGDEFTPEQTEKAKGVLAEVKRITGEIKGAQESDGLHKALDALDVVTDDDGPITEADVKAMQGRPGIAGGLRQAVKSWGEQFTESESFHPFKDRFEGKDVPSGARIEVPRVGMKVLPFTEGGAAQGVPLLSPDERGLIDQGPFQRPLTLRDMVSNGRTSQLAVRYARVTGFTNAATGVHEAGTVTGTNAAGGLKPQSDLATAIFTATVVTIAHWFAASKQSLADIPLLRSLIDSFGRYGLAEEEEDQMIAGTGSANDQLDGFSLVTGVQTQAFVTNIFVSVRKAITLVRKNGLARANAVLMNLEDEETVDLFRVGGSTTTDGPWAGNGPFRSGPNTLWGLPIISTPAVAASTAYVADFRTILFLMREDPSVAITDSHADYFVRNLIALLFEERATQLVLRPSAIVKVTTA